MPTNQPTGKRRTSGAPFLAPPTRLNWPNWLLSDPGLNSLANQTGIGVVVSTATDSYALRDIGVDADNAIPDRLAADTRYHWRGQYAGRNTVAADHTLIPADAGKVVESNAAGAIVVTVPDDAAASIAVGSWVDLFRFGAGALTVTPGAGVTLNSAGGNRNVSPQFGAARLVKRAANDWTLAGDLAP